MFVGEGVCRMRTKRREVGSPHSSWPSPRLRLQSAQTDRSHQPFYIYLEAGDNPLLRFHRGWSRVHAPISRLGSNHTQNPGFLSCFVSLCTGNKQGGFGATASLCIPFFTRPENERVRNRQTAIRLPVMKYLRSTKMSSHCSISEPFGGCADVVLALGQIVLFLPSSKIDRNSWRVSPKGGMRSLHCVPITHSVRPIEGTDFCLWTVLSFWGWQRWLNSGGVILFLLESFLPLSNARRSC